MEDQTTNSQTSEKKGGAGKFFKGLFMVLLSIAIGAGIVFFLVKQKPEFLGLPKDAAQTQEEVTALVAEVSSLIALPEDETPTVATITDVEKIRNQTFFKSAENGDKVLIYTNAKKAILYRPSAKKVIEVGAVNINQQPNPDASTAPEDAMEEKATPTTKPTVAPTVAPTSEATQKPVNTFNPSQITQ